MITESDRLLPMAAEDNRREQRRWRDESIECHRERSSQVIQTKN
jgi:hypothetical protein